LTLLLALASVSPTRGFDQEASGRETATTTVKVDAKHPWVDSGLSVRKGERLSFKAVGTIRWGSALDEVAGPEGHGAKPGKLGKGGLIGRVGSNGKPFPIGSTTTPIVMTKSGKLFLGINDFIFADNDGAFTVTVSHATAGQPPAVSRQHPDGLRRRSAG
jgi:hypothetical protein